MARLVLEFHSLKELKPTDESEIVVLFLFTLQSEDDRKAGIKPNHNQAFWTETTFARDLSGRGAWAKLSRADKLRAMFRYARDCIVDRGEKLRQVHLFWSPLSPLSAGPPWPDTELASMKFPEPSAIVFEPEGALATSTSRDAAGLNK